MIYYSDLTPDISKDLNNDVSRAVNIRSVKNSLLAIVTTRKGSRPFYPDFGCDLTSELFENMNPLVEDTIQNSIIEAIRNFEPRVDRLKVSVIAIPDSNEILTKILFSIITDPDKVEELRIAMGG